MVDLFDDNELTEKCFQEKIVTIKPTITLIQRQELIQSVADQHKHSAQYFLEGAKTLLTSRTPLLVILLGYFAMEHKANQLLALRGYKVESHVCTQLALSRILHQKELARKISEVFDLWQHIGYRLFLEQNEEEQNNAVKVLKEDVTPFFKKIDDLITEQKP